MDRTWEDYFLGSIRFPTFILSHIRESEYVVGTIKGTMLKIGSCFTSRGSI